MILSIPHLNYVATISSQIINLFFNVSVYYCWRSYNSSISIIFIFCLKFWYSYIECLEFCASPLVRTSCVMIAIIACIISDKPLVMRLIFEYRRLRSVKTSLNDQNKRCGTRLRHCYITTTTHSLTGASVRKRQRCILYAWKKPHETRLKTDSIRHTLYVSGVNCY